jgi:hypothetical protein
LRRCRSRNWIDTGNIAFNCLVCIIVLRLLWGKREQETFRLVRCPGGIGGSSAWSCFLSSLRWRRELSKTQLSSLQQCTPTRRSLCGSTWIAMRLVGLLPCPRLRRSRLPRSMPLWCPQVRLCQLSLSKRICTTGRLPPADLLLPALRTGHSN